MNWVEALQQLAFLILIAGGVATVIAAVLLLVIWRRLKRIQLPANAGFWEAIRSVPLGLVVALDLLDFAFDFMAAPVIWFILRRTGLEQLRNVAVIESLIPFTQALPTLTIAWVVARAFAMDSSSLGFPDSKNKFPGGKDDGPIIDVPFRAAS